MTKADWQAELRANPDSESTRLAYSDWLEENGGDQWAIDALRAGKIPCDKVDDNLVLALQKCRFAPASWPRRFINDVYVKALSGRLIVSPLQYKALWDTAWTYRSQTHGQYTEYCPRKPSVDRMRRKRPVAPAFESWVDENS